MSSDVSSPCSGERSACVSCYYGESTAILSKNHSFDQQRFIAPPLPELKFYLVGKGSRGPECGAIRSGYICSNPDCSKPHYTAFHCKRKACPDCYGSWIKDETAKISARLLSNTALNSNKGRRLVHIVLSPSESSAPVTRAELRALFNEGYEYITEKGAAGGAVIFHAFRATKYAKRCAQGAHQKTWAWIRSQTRPAAYYRFSPHLHLVTFINYMKEPKEGEVWIYKTITNDKGHVVDFMRKAKREKELKQLIGYLLTHAVIREGEEEPLHSVRWYGSCSYNQLKITEEEKTALIDPIPIPKCKVCGSDLIPFWEWIRSYYGDVIWGGMDPPPFWDEIQDALDGDPPPDDYHEYFVGEVK